MKPYGGNLARIREKSATRPCLAVRSQQEPQRRQNQRREDGQLRETVKQAATGVMNRRWRIRALRLWRVAGARG